MGGSITSSAARAARHQRCAAADVLSVQRAQERDRDAAMLMALPHSGQVPISETP